ncbi:MAG TPA: hypothetical protein VL357_09670 [Rariglobus sp.]|jgi:hypothetical protein|nr:hypothetical protein [Rariglobus sp.]
MEAFTLFHVLLSLIGIFTGFVVVRGMITGKPGRGWTAVFLATTVATSVTGFLFPYNGFTPALGTGIVSMVVLAIAVLALYGRHLAGAWRGTYVVNAVLALYLNVFVLIVQLFLKVPALKALAPTQKEPPFAIAQGAALLLFVVLGVLAWKRFRPAAA